MGDTSIPGSNGNVIAAAQTGGPIEKMAAATVERADAVKPAHAQQSTALRASDAMTMIDGRADGSGTRLTKGRRSAHHRPGTNEGHHQQG